MKRNQQLLIIVFLILAILFLSNSQSSTTGDYSKRFKKIVLCPDECDTAANCGLWSSQWDCVYRTCKDFPKLRHRVCVARTTHLRRWNYNFYTGGRD